MAFLDTGLVFGGADAYGGYSDGWYWLAGAANIAVGSNPPYGISNFAVMYPKFLGLPVSATGATTIGSPIVVLTAACPTTAGQLIVGASIPSNTVAALVSADGLTITLSQPATATMAATALSVYAAPLIPLPVLMAYIALATAALSQSRWNEQWSISMALYVAHWATLWLLTEGTPGQLPQQMALAAAQRGVGVLTSKSADGVSASYQPVKTAESWGSWGLTAYGVQLVGMARLVGMGGMWLQGGGICQPGSLY